MTNAPGEESGVATAVPPTRRRRGRIALTVALAIALTAGGSFLLTRPRGPDVALALEFREGATYRYRLTMSFDGTLELPLVEMPMVGKLSETIVYHVLSVEPDGAATIDLSVEEVEGSVAGQPVPDVTDLDIRMVIAPDGSVREVDGTPVPAALQQAWSDPTGSGGLPGMQSFPFLPEGPVGPGDEWVKDIEQPLPFGQGEVAVHAENEFARYEDVGSIRAAVIESEISSPIDWSIDLAEAAELAVEVGGSETTPEELEGLPDRISYRGDVLQDQTTWLDPSRGEVLRTELNGEFDITTRAEGGKGFGALLSALPVHFVGDMDVTMERVTP
ncbi:MAG: hypothetical protein ACRDKA_02655 [Actinomycetota bacterium]